MAKKTKLQRAISDAGLFIFLANVVAGLCFIVGILAVASAFGMAAGTDQDMAFTIGIGLSLSGLFALVVNHTAKVVVLYVRDKTEAT